MSRLRGHFGLFRSRRIPEMFRRLGVSRNTVAGFAAAAAAIVVALGAVRRDGERATPRTTAVSRR